MEETRDMVNHPYHYISETGLETIDVIEAFTCDLMGIEATDTGNILKYMCRWKHKNGLEDLKKAKWYLEHLIKHVEKMEVENNEEEVCKLYADNTIKEVVKYMDHASGEAWESCGACKSVSVDRRNQQFQVRRHHCQPGRRETRRRGRLRFTAERQHGKTLHDCRRKLRKG
jgi:hypothetical protein